MIVIRNVRRRPAFGSFLANTTCSSPPIPPMPVYEGGKQSSQYSAECGTITIASAPFADLAVTKVTTAGFGSSWATGFRRLDRHQHRSAWSGTSVNQWNDMVVLSRDSQFSTQTTSSWARSNIGAPRSQRSYSESHEVTIPEGFFISGRTIFIVFTNESVNRSH